MSHLATEAATAVRSAELTEIPIEFSIGLRARVGCPQGRPWLDHATVKLGSCVVARREAELA